MGELKPGWKRVKFGDVVRLGKERCADPVAAGIERYIGLEHLEPGDLRVRTWGDVSDGTTFTNRVRPGNVLFGKRRAYQKKIAVADFDAVCSGDIYVFESVDPKRLLPELLPFLCQTDAFFEYAVGTSAGSLSPRTNWTSLAEYEFALPPLNEQRRIAALLTTSEVLIATHREAAAAAHTSYRSAASDLLGSLWQHASLIPLGDLNDHEAPICYGIVKLGDVVTMGVPVLRTENLNGDYENDLYFARDDVDAAYRRSRVKGGDILIAIQGVSTGKLGVVPHGFVGNINRHLARVRLGSRLNARYFVHLWRSDAFTARLRSATGGTTKPELTIGGLRLLKIPCPPPHAQSQYADALGSGVGARDACRTRHERARRMHHDLLVATLEGSA